jgi:hypothetical protein
MKNKSVLVFFCLCLFTKITSQGNLLEISNSIKVKLKDNNFNYSIEIDTIFGRKTRSLAFNLNDSLDVKFGTRFSEISYCDFLYCTLDNYSFVHNNRRISFIGFLDFEYGDDKKIIVSDLSNNPIFGFVLNDNYDFIIYVEFQSKVEKTSYLGKTIKKTINLRDVNLDFILNPKLELNLLPLFESEFLKD